MPHGEDHGWQDRLREAAYTGPSGIRLTFQYEDVKRATTKRTTAFEFSGIDGAYIQDNGFGARRYPMRIFFSGSDHDIEATRFELLLLETGVGKLEHPLYGLVTVVPFGDITRVDNLKTGANQTIIEVTFWTTLGVLFPSSVGSPVNELQAVLDAYNAASANQFGDVMDIENSVARAAAGASIRDLLLSTSAALTSVSEATLSITREFRELESTINLGIDVLIGQPLQIAGLISNLITLPGRALAGIRDRLEAYGLLASDVYGSDAANPAQTLIGQTFLPLRTTVIANDFHTSDLFAAGTVAGSVTATINHEFTTRPEALESAEIVLNQFDAFVDFRDTGFRALETIPGLGPFQLDAGESYQQLQKAVALMAGYLIETSFSLKPERRIVLDRPRTIVDLSAELYGEVDSRLDFMISSNDLTGSEILELPRGKLILYYSD